MDAIALLEKIDRGDVEGAYVLVGPERFLVEQIVDRLKEEVVGGAMADFNFRRLVAGDVSGAAVANEAREVPMLARGRLVVVDGCEKLRAADLEALDAYLADPAPGNCLVLTATKLDLRRGAISRANRRGQVHRADPLKERHIGQFVRSRAAARGFRMTRGAESAIAAAVGPDCFALDDAVERAGLHAGPGREIGEDDVAEVVSPIRQRSVFDLVDAIGTRRRDAALSLLERLLSGREEPIRLNAMLARHVRQLLESKIHLHRGGDERDLAAALRVPPFVAGKLASQGRGFRGAELEAALARLARADLDLKSSRRAARLILEEAVTDLCLGGG